MKLRIISRQFVCLYVLSAYLFVSLFAVATSLRSSVPLVGHPEHTNGI